MLVAVSGEIGEGLYRHTLRDNSRREETLFLSPESAVKYAPSRGYIIFFPSLSLPYEKSVYESTSFFISVCFRELKSFLTLNRGKKIT